MNSNVKYSGAHDPALQALSAEQRVAAFNAGEIAGQKPPTIGDRARAFRSEQPLTDQEMTHMRALQKQLRLFEAEGKAHMMSRQKYELGLLLERHGRTAPPSQSVMSISTVGVTNSVRLAGLRAALLEAEQRQNWGEAASLMSAIAQIEAGLE